MTEKELDEKAIEARREYKRQWQRSHREATQRYQRDYWRRVAAAKAAEAEKQAGEQEQAPETE